jgi:hypothetical protein
MIRKVELFTKELVLFLSSITPIFLILCILTIGIFNGYLETVHYSKVIGGMSWIPGTMFAGLRFASGLGGVKMFMNEDKVRGGIFVFISVMLTIWVSTHAKEIASSITLTDSQYDNALWFVRTSLWTGLLGELMMAAFMTAKRHRMTRKSNK